jgi:hypothetical protein
MENIRFEFIEEFKIESNNFNSLTPTQKEQLIACIPLCLIESDAENMDTSDIVNLFREEKGGWAFACFYHIINKDTDEIVFDFWVFNEDTGIIFETNTKNNLEIYMLDYTFELAKENMFNKKLPKNFTVTLQHTFSN